MKKYYLKALDKIQSNQHFLLKYILPFICLFLVVYIRNLLNLGLTSSPYLFFSLVVVLQAIVAGTWSAIFTSLISLLFVNYYFLEPVYELKLATESQVFQGATYLLQSILLSILVGSFFSNRKRMTELMDNISISTQKFRNIIDNIFTLIIITDKNGKVVEANKPYAEVFPNKWDDVMEHRIFDLHPWTDNPELNERLKASYKEVLKTSPVKFNADIILDGKQIYTEVTVLAVRKRNKLKTLENIVVTVKDKTDRKLYEKEVLKNRNVITKLLDSNIVGMVLKNSKGEILDANPTFLKLTGYTEEELREHKINWFDIDSETRVLDNRAGIALNDETIEKELVRKDGTVLPVLTSRVPVNQEEDLSLRVIVDLTLQKDAQKKKDEFISIASHELKTPMTVIKGYLQILDKKLAKSEVDYSKFLRSIDFQLNKLNTLVNELHDISKIESDKLKVNLEKININDLVKSSVEAVLPFTDNHVFDVNEKDQDIMIVGDVIRLEQVLVNLLTNAIKYSNSGSHIIVTVEKSQGESIVSVKDDGIGIPEDQLENIFNKFFQVEGGSELREGLGLGLYISSQIIKKHNGLISVESRQGNGSTFSFRIPLAQK